MTRKIARRKLLSRTATACEYCKSEEPLFSLNDDSGSAYSFHNPILCAECYTKKYGRSPIREQPRFNGVCAMCRLPKTINDVKFIDIENISRYICGDCRKKLNGNKINDE